MENFETLTNEQLLEVKGGTVNGGIVSKIVEAKAEGVIGEIVE